MSSVTSLVAVAEEQTRELPMSPYAFGAVAFAAFLLGLAVLWFFRGTAQKIADGHGSHGPDHHGGEAAHTGSDHPGGHP